MQNPQNALDHPLSSLSIQWQERHDRLPPRDVDQLEFSPRGGDLPDLADRNRAAVQQPRRQVVFASVALVSADAPGPPVPSHRDMYRTAQPVRQLTSQRDRKYVVQGTGVSVRVVFG